MRRHELPRSTCGTFHHLPPPAENTPSGKVRFARPSTMNRADGFSFPIRVWTLQDEDTDEDTDARSVFLLERSSGSRLLWGASGDTSFIYSGRGLVLPGGPSVCARASVPPPSTRLFGDV